MYKENADNQGLRCIKEILDRSEIKIEYSFFDVRSQFEIPDLDFDVYISTGGPGNPLEYNVNWSDRYFNLIDRLFIWNKNNPDAPKFLYSICHSFQMLCSHTGIASITKREHVSFGIVPLKKTKAGLEDPVLNGLDAIFYAADHRHFQVINPDLAKIDNINASIIVFDEIDPTQTVSRSVMAVRFSPEIVGVQFHPEADVTGMKTIIARETVQAEIAKVYGKNKLGQIRSLLDDPHTIERMNQTMIPMFLRSCQNRLTYSPIIEAVNESV
ncbi:MAG TPA: hypothetical protein VK590_09445 [Saprospiraceae bacterium]|nr:hypothetical protein [Saprospiraceae bacterium]